MSKQRWMSVCVFMLCPLWVHAQTPRERFDAAVRDLAKTPADHAKRQSMLELLRDVKPKPAIPADAERFDGRAQYAFRSAKSEAEMLNAAREYLKAIEAAPWVADYYFNLCAILEKANRPAEAMRACKLYLAAAPEAPDASEIRKRIAGLEYALEQSRGTVTRRRECVNWADMYETGGKVALIHGRRISAKLISSLYGGVWRNQLLLADVTARPVNALQRWDLDPMDRTLQHEDRVAGSPWFRLTIARDGRITFGGSGSTQAEIVTSIVELHQLRNAQMSGCSIGTKGDKFFVELGQGGPAITNDGAKVGGTLYFESDCAGKLVGDKPGWFPAVFIPHRETPGVTSEQASATAQGFREASADACRQASNDRLGWLAL